MSAESSVLLGRSPLLRELRSLITREHNVLLFGPAGVGKSSVIAAVSSIVLERGIVVADPFEAITTREAAAIRRHMDNGKQYLAAARTLDRDVLGAVRRIAWRFSTLRVEGLPLRLMRRVVSEGCMAVDLSPGPEWVDSACSLAMGRPGVGLAIVSAAARLQVQRKAMPSATLSFIDARMRESAFIFDKSLVSNPSKLVPLEEPS